MAKYARLRPHARAMRRNWTQEQIEEIVREEFPGKPAWKWTIRSFWAGTTGEPGRCNTTGQGICECFSGKMCRKMIIHEEQELRLVRRGPGIFAEAV